MNHCLDCNSMYATPGSCNCFAPGGKRAAFQPYAPTVAPTVVPITTPGVLPHDGTGAPYPGWVWISEAGGGREAMSTPTVTITSQWEEAIARASIETTATVSVGCFDPAARYPA